MRSQSHCKLLKNHQSTVNLQHYMIQSHSVIVFIHPHHTSLHSRPVSTMELLLILLMLPSALSKLKLLILCHPDVSGIECMELITQGNAERCGLIKETVFVRLICGLTEEVFVVSILSVTKERHIRWAYKTGLLKQVIQRHSLLILKEERQRPLIMDLTCVSLVSRDILIKMMEVH